MHRHLVLAFILGLFTPLLFASGLAFGEGYILQNATIKQVSVGKNLNSFTVYTTGGSGSCINKEVFFLKANFPDVEIYKMTLSVALTAYTTGNLVEIYTYGGALNDCTTGQMIRVYK